MALSTTADYKAVLNKIINLKGVNHDAWVRSAGISSADADQVISEYNTWKLAQADRIHQTKQTTAHA